MKMELLEYRESISETIHLIMIITNNSRFFYIENFESNNINKTHKYSVYLSYYTTFILMHVNNQIFNFLLYYIILYIFLPLFLVINNCSNC